MRDRWEYVPWFIYVLFCLAFNYPSWMPSSSGLSITTRCLVVDAHAESLPHRLLPLWQDVFDFSEWLVTSFLTLKTSPRPSIFFIPLHICINCNSKIPYSIKLILSLFPLWILTDTCSLVDKKVTFKLIAWMWCRSSLFTFHWHWIKHHMAKSNISGVRKYLHMWVGVCKYSSK